MITGGPCLLWLKNLERSTSKQASPWPRTLPSSEAFTNAPSVDLRNFAPKLICIIGESRVSLVLTLDCQSLTAAQCNGWVFHWSAVGAKRWSTRFGSTHAAIRPPATCLQSVMAVAGMERAAFMGGGCASFAAFSVVIDHFMKFS